MNQTEQEIIDKLESVGSKSVKLVEKVGTASVPLFSKLLSTIERMLDSALVDKPGKVSNQ